MKIKILRCAPPSSYVCDFFKYQKRLQKSTVVQKLKRIVMELIVYIQLNMYVCFQKAILCMICVYLYVSQFISHWVHGLSVTLRSELETKHSDQHWVSEPILQAMVQFWLWCSQVADKKIGVCIQVWMRINQHMCETLNIIFACLGLRRLKISTLNQACLTKNVLV